MLGILKLEISLICMHLYLPLVDSMLGTDKLINLFDFHHVTLSVSSRFHVGNRQAFKLL